MSILCDWEIAELCKGDAPMISPYVDESVNFCPDKLEKVISYGLSSFGYDARVGNKFKIFTNTFNTVVDPKNFNSTAFVDYEGDVCIIPPNSFVLAHTFERFTMPKNVVGICTGKSTLARSGISTLVTPLEPGWEGWLTLEFANVTPLPVKLYAGEGGVQINFYRGNTPNVTYNDRSGKYQHQPNDVVLPKV